VFGFGLARAKGNARRFGFPFMRFAHIVHAMLWYGVYFEFRFEFCFEFCFPEGEFETEFETQFETECATQLNTREPKLRGRAATGATFILSARLCPASVKQL
jgi:hypothetical protein